MPDTDKPAEILLFDFLAEQIEAAVAEDVLFEVELHDTIYQTITKPRGLRISDAVGSMVPGGDGAIREHGVSVQLVCFAKVAGKDKKARQPALTQVWELEKEMYRLLYTDNSLGGRVCDVEIEMGSRSYDVMNGEPYAVANIPLVINPHAGY